MAFWHCSELLAFTERATALSRCITNRDPSISYQLVNRNILIFSPPCGSSFMTVGHGFSSRVVSKID